MKKGWQTKKLGDVCGLQNGFAFKSNLFSETGYPILRISNIQDEAIETRRVVFFQLKDYKENLDKYRVVSGDLLIAMSGGTTGKIGFNTTDQVYYLNQRVGKFEPKDCLSKKYLFYFLSTRVEENLRISAGSAQPNLSTEQIKDFDIPLPPLPEQQRIGNILDEAFDGIATAKANAEKNLQNARALFESHLNDVFTKKGDGWVKKSLGDICQVVGGGTPPKNRPDFYSGDIPWATVRDMREDIITKTECMITKEAIKNCSTNVIPAGNVIIATRVGLGKVCRIEQDTAINQDLRGIVPNDAKGILTLFLFWWLKSIAHLIEGEGTGATVQGVKLPFIKSLKINLPPVRQQKDIVAHIESLHDNTKRLESIYQQKLAALTALKKTLLHQAFTGEL